VLGRILGGRQPKPFGAFLTLSGRYHWVAQQVDSATSFTEPMSSSARQAGSPHVAAVLMQNHSDDLSFRIAFEVELRVDNLVKELVPGARKNRCDGLSGELCFEMIAIQRDIEYAGIELVFANVVAERGGIKRDFLKRWYGVPVTG
jgi:hypothetical protein